MLSLTFSPGEQLIDSGDVTSALQYYLQSCAADNLDWWAFYRASWCFNQLDQTDSAVVYADRALYLQPVNENCLAELLKALSENPENVLEYSRLVSGGGVCRYRLAKAELQLNRFQGESLCWLLDRFENGDSLEQADAGCWLSLLFPVSGLDYIDRAVSLSPDVVFYRYLLLDKLVESECLQRAEEEFSLLNDSGDTGFWQAAAALHQAQGQESRAVNDLRMAYNLRRTPSTGAELGWRLYFLGGELISENRNQEAIPLLIECSNTWNSESTWAARADSLLNHLNEFTSVSDGFGEPI